jgi:hypothetical protein
VLSLGLPAVIVLAWFHGEQGRQRVSPVEATLLAAILIAMAVVLRYAALENRAIVPSEPATGAAALETRRHRIAILPLASVGGDDADATLAGGIHETPARGLTHHPFATRATSSCSATPPRATGRLRGLLERLLERRAATG